VFGGGAPLISQPMMLQEHALEFELHALAIPTWMKLAPCAAFLALRECAEHDISTSGTLRVLHSDYLGVPVHPLTGLALLITFAADIEIHVR
jgi:hypothetical protein